MANETRDRSVSTRRLRWSRRLAGLAIVALVAVAIGFLGSRVTALRSIPAVEEPAIPTVRVEAAVARPLEIHQRYTGTITARERYAVAAQVNATVLAVPKREGDRVREGELLASLDATEFRAEVGRQQAALERLEAELAYREAQLARYRALFSKSAVSEQALDDSERQVRTLEASVRESREVLRQARTRLRYTDVRAPSDGFIQSVYVLPGDLARAGSPLLELLDDRALKLKVMLPQDDLAKLTIGAPVDVEVAALGYRTNAFVNRLYPALDARTRTATAEIFLPDVHDGIRPGMLASVWLQLDRIDAAITVPIQAVHYSGGTPGVFVDSAGTAKWRVVQTGHAIGKRLHIVDGIEPGMAVIVTPDSRLADGIAIRRATSGDKS